MSFLRQTPKKLLLYALIGFFVIGGVGVLSSKTALADTVSCSLSNGGVFQMLSPAAGSPNEVTGSITTGTPSSYGFAVIQGGTQINGNGGFNPGGNNFNGNGGYTLYIIDAISNTSWNGSIWTDLSSGIVGAFFYSVDAGGSNLSLNCSSPDDPRATRIVSFTPPDGYVATTTEATTTIDFLLHVFINPKDIGNVLTIKINYRNVDQNTLLNAPCDGSSPGFFSGCSQYSITIFSGNATTSGDVYIGTSTPLARGNYRVEASLDTSTQFLGVNLGFFSFVGAESQVQDHQFIVGSSTLIGNLSQNLYTDLNSFFGTLPATTSQALAGTCNPIGGSFDVRQCMVFLFIPDSAQLNTAMTSFRDGVLIHAPWGYVTRFVSILTNTSTSSLPTFTVNLGIPGSPLASSTLTFDPGDMLAGGAAIIDSIPDPISGKTAKSIFMPLIQLGVALSVIITIALDLLGMAKGGHKDRNEK